MNGKRYRFTIEVAYAEQARQLRAILAAQRPLRFQYEVLDEAGFTKWREEGDPTYDEEK